MENHIRKFIKVMKAASDTTRVKILKMLQKKEMHFRKEYVREIISNYLEQGRSGS